MSDTIEQVRANLQRFANDHKIVFQDHGEVGFMRPCVGFLHSGNYVDWRPLDNTSYEPLAGFDGDAVAPPASCPDAYHKHDCMAVLVHGDDYDAALVQLNEWVKKLDAIGVEVARFETGASGVQALFSGVFGHAIRPLNSHDSAVSQQEEASKQE